MPPVRRVALLCLLVGGVTVAAAGGEEPGAVPVCPSASASAPEAAARIHAAEGRLATLLERAQQDLRLAKADRYLSYGAAEFKSPKREVRAADLVGILSDRDAPAVARERARDALKSPAHRGLDPDLETSNDGRSKRSSFSLARLVPLLSTRDETTRTLASDVLVSFFYPSDLDIQRYNPRDGNDRTWTAAQAAWRRVLASR